MIDVRSRLEVRIREWDVDVEEFIETESSIVALGRRHDQRVVLKVVRKQGDEWRSGEVLAAFGGRGVARVYEFLEGAMLLERLAPATTLASVALDGRDEEATEILADVVRRMSHPAKSPKSVATVEDWARAFDRYLASGDDQIPRDLVERATDLYSSLEKSQKNTRLLHGDLQHYNVLLDSERGWVAIDPKGVIGEIEYELGAGLRNPSERPDLFLSSRVIERRVGQYADALNVDPNRVLSWGFAQAVLSAIWGVEDGYRLDTDNPVLDLATTIDTILTL